jgi:hypothetical protein
MSSLNDRMRVMMTFQEKRALVSTGSTLVISVLYLLWVMQRSQADAATIDFSFWAAAILILIPVHVAFKVLIHVLFVVVNVAATREAEPRFTDELDKLVGLKALRNFCLVFMTGFLLAMGTAALGQPPSVMFLVLLLTASVAGVILEASEFYFYRNGV